MASDSVNLLLQNAHIFQRLLCSAEFTVYIRKNDDLDLHLSLRPSYSFRIRIASSVITQSASAVRKPI